MHDIKSTIAKNITELRRTCSMTQLELAEKLSYSDKAVSKWERGESVPDITVLAQIATLFGVTVDYLIQDEHPNTHEDDAAEVIDDHDEKNDKRNRLIISMLAASLVWLIATVIFVSVGLSSHGFVNMWKVYIYCLPVTCIVLLVFNSIWGIKRRNFLIISALIWTLLLSFYVLFLNHNIWIIFFIGIPGQIIVLLWSGLKMKN